MFELQLLQLSNMIFCMELSIIEGQTEICCNCMASYFIYSYSSSIKPLLCTIEFPVHLIIFTCIVHYS